jgi:DNA-binding XRE family transcriptional regulator
VSSNLQRLREERMMSKAELARRSGLSTLTINRVEAGRPCRLETKRKILQALQLGISDQERVFGTQGASAARGAGAESRP